MLIKLKYIDYTIILFLLLNLFFFRYLRVLYTEFYIFDALILLYVTARMVNNIRVNLFVAYSWAFLFLILFLNASTFGLNRVFIDNALMAFTPMTYLFFFIYIIEKYTIDAIEKIILFLKRVLNVYFFFNTILIYIQIKTQYFMMSKFLVFNPAWFDHADGFIGANGVSVLNFLWIATIFYNLYFYFKEKRKKTLLLIIFQLILIAHMSSLNDNKMLFLTLLPMLFMFYFIIYINKSLSVKSILKTYAFIIIFSLIGLLIFNNDLFSSQVEKITVLVNDFFYGTGRPSQDNERAYLNYMAFAFLNASHFGIGLSNLNFKTQTIHVHLGINSSSLLLIQGGLIYLIAVINVYSLLILRFFPYLNRLKKFGVFLVAIGITTTLAYATQLFRDHYISISLSLIFLVMALIVKKSSIDKHTN